MMTHKVFYENLHFYERRHNCNQIVDLAIAARIIFNFIYENETMIHVFAAK